MNTFDCDVIIVGGGPVGLGLAIELGQRSVRTTIVERFIDIQPIPKGQNLTQRTMEHFHFWGIEQAIRAAAPRPLAQGIGGQTAYRTLLSNYHYDWYQRSLVRPYYFTDNERLPQYETERVLRERVAAIPGIAVNYGCSAKKIAQTEEGVSVDIEDGGGRKRTLHGRYLVGCDGSRSIVREQAGITQTVSDHGKLMVLLVFHSPELGRLVSHYKGKSFFNVLHPALDGYWLFFGRVDQDENWFFHAPVPPGTTRDNFDFQTYLHDAVGATFACELKHIGFWDLRFAVADTYRQTNVFIAGDAAHSHPPYGGFGINTGFEDAKNLGWKIAATLQGWGGDGLLDSYTRERQPVFASTARNFIAKFIDADRDFLRSFDPERDKAAFEAAWDARKEGAAGEIQSFEPNYEGSPIVFGPQGGQSGAVGSHSFEAKSGHHLAPQPLSSGKSVFEALGDGFTLLAFDDDEVAASRFETAAKTAGVPLKVIRDSLAGGREAYGAHFVLVRPDQFVAWADDAAPADAAAIIRQATGRD